MWAFEDELVTTLDHAIISTKKEVSKFIALLNDIMMPCLMGAFF